MSTVDNQLKSREAIRCTWIGSLLDLFLGVSKIIVGVLFHSAALVADGIHSLSDLVTDFMVVLVIKISNQGPDKNHPYGHERFETLGTVALGFILVAIAGAMAYDSIDNLRHLDAAQIPGWPTLIVAFISIVGKEWIFRYTIAVGKRLKSDLLIANAWHSRTDAYSSIIVLVGIAGTMAGIHWLDAATAIIVAIFVAKIGWDLCWKSLKELVDTAIEPELEKDIRQTVASVEGIENVHNFKSRLMGQKILLEMHLQVKPYLSASEGHFIGDSVVARILQEHDNIGHVIYHIDTEDDEHSRLCPVLPFRSEISTIIDAELQRLAPQLCRQHMHLYYLHGKVEIDVLVAELPESAVDEPAPLQKKLAEQLNEKLSEYPWFQHLNLWLER